MAGHMLQLPGEITSMVFSELSAKDIQRSRAVCRHFRDHIDHPKNQAALIRALEDRSSAARGKLVESLLGTGDDDFLDHLLRFLLHRGLTVFHDVRFGYALMQDDMAPFTQCFNYRRPTPIPWPDIGRMVLYIVRRLLPRYGFGARPASTERIETFFYRQRIFDTTNYFLPQLEGWEDAIRTGRVAGLSPLDAVDGPRFATDCNCRPDTICGYRINLPAGQQRFSWDRGPIMNSGGLEKCISGYRNHRARRHHRSRILGVGDYDRVRRLFELEDLPVPGLIYCAKNQWASDWIGKALSGVEISPLLRTALLEEITVF